MNKEQAALQIIAIEVSNSKHGDFLKHVANAWLIADRQNKLILKATWVVLIEKYRLDKEYADAIEEHIEKYLEAE